MRVPGEDLTSGPRVTGDTDVQLRDGLRFALIVFVVVWIGWALLSVIGTLTFPPGHPLGVPGLPARGITPGWHNLVLSGNQGDALWYQRIATQGYRPDDNSAAFFPLFPFLIHAGSLIPGISPVAAAIVVAQASFGGSLTVLYALTVRELGVANARRATWYLAVFPTAFFLLAPLTESTFLLLSLLTFWNARRDRWGWAALFGMLSALTRSVGFVLAGALLVEALAQWRSHGRRAFPRLLASGGPVLGLGIYFLAWQLAGGDWRKPLDAQQAWQRSFTLPPRTLWNAVDAAWHFQSYWLIDLLVVSIVLVCVLAGIGILPPTYFAYGLLSVLLPLFDPYPGRPLLSMPRFVLVVFPAFWVIAIAVGRRRLANALVTAAFIGGFCLLGLLFMNAYAIF